MDETKVAGFWLAQDDETLSVRASAARPLLAALYLATVGVICGPMAFQTARRLLTGAGPGGPLFSGVGLAVASLILLVSLGASIRSVGAWRVPVVLDRRHNLIHHGLREIGPLDRVARVEIRAVRQRAVHYSVALVFGDDGPRPYPIDMGTCHDERPVRAFAGRVAAFAGVAVAPSD